MTDLIMTLKECVLFKNLTVEDLQETLKSIDYRTVSFGKETPIAIEDEECLDIGIVIKGSVEVQKLYASGRLITIDRLKSGDLFGQVIIFSQINKFPATIIASESTDIMYISKGTITNLCSSNTTILL